MSIGRGYLLRAAGALLLLALLGGAGMLGQWHEARRREREVLTRSASVVAAVRELARLETAEYHLERIIDLRQEQPLLFGLLESEDALLLVAAGDVTAGVDLATLGEGDVQVDLPAGRVLLRLPAPAIFRAALDERRTYVHSRRTGLLARRDERLEGRARAQAVDSFIQAAHQAGILERARTQAERLVRTLLRELGFREVVIAWRPAPPAPWPTQPEGSAGPYKSSP
ncbi:MAG: DUF4230 domain-containing protein [Myxococcales bacterium]|nr:DUF4230 domain-containing protein [Myxococcota bacterium]MDW8282947.1 DUF4230 domain-containing protein [Myxococcales bacterium]